MDHVNIVVKVTDACNLRCSYCYNSDSGYLAPVLPLERFEKFLEILSSRYKSIDVIWHGGEPMLAGMEYLKKAVEAEQRVTLLHGTAITNKIQTNGTLIDKKWVDFFKKYDFKPGLSFDGIENEKHRQGTDKVLRAFSLLQKAKVNFGTLAVVADKDYDLIENYKFFASRKIVTDFSPLFSEGGARNLTALGAEDYAAKVIDLFDYWLYDKEGVNVRLFSAYISMILGKNRRICNTSSCIGTFFSIHPDGEIYNCGRASMAAYPFGNIDEIEKVEDLFASQGFRDLLIGSIKRRDKCKATCDLFPYCCGNCSDQAIIEGSLDTAPSFSCYAFKAIFTHICDKIESIVADKVPLTSLNPAMKRIMIDCFAVEDDFPTDKK